jgi:hypothetical protein
MQGIKEFFGKMMNILKEGKPIINSLRYVVVYNDVLIIVHAPILNATPDVKV